jgi:L-lysine exporter family protein LysE/ArgO
MIQQFFSSYFSGVLMGFLLCVSFGTVFFALIQNSIDNGYWSGVKISIGGIFSDLMFIIAALFGTSFLPKISNFDMILRSIGVFFLIGIGLASFFKRSPKLAYPQTKVGDLFYYVSLGFMLNTINPINFFIWAATAATISYLDPFHQVIFFIGSIGAIFLTQFTICYYAHYLQRYFTANTIITINKIAGLVFIGTGIYLGSIVVKFLMN